MTSCTLHRAYLLALNRGATTRIISMADEEAWPTFRSICAFAVVSIASSTMSEVCRKHLRLPLITGYILAGILCGPYSLGLLSSVECKNLARIIVDDAMGFIGFSAGSKFLLSELQGSLKPVLSVLFGLVSVTYCLVLVGVYLASPYLSFTASLPQEQVVAISMITACLAVARSPSSAIAIISELGAHGSFTTLALSVTVLMDVVVVLLFVRARTIWTHEPLGPRPVPACPSLTQSSAPQSLAASAWLLCLLDPLDALGPS